MLKRILLLAAALLTAAHSHAIINGSYTANIDGTFTYNYTIDNTGGTFDITGFTLEFPIPAAQIDWDANDIGAAGDVTVPTDWIAFLATPSAGGQSAQDFLSIAFTGDVLIGQSLSGFSFTSGFAPQPVTYTIEHGAGGEFELGTTVGPALAASVPDASGTLVLSLFAFSVIFCLHRRAAWVQKRI